MSVGDLAPNKPR